MVKSITKSKEKTRSIKGKQLLKRKQIPKGKQVPEEKQKPELEEEERPKDEQRSEEMEKSEALQKTIRDRIVFEEEEPKMTQEPEDEKAPEIEQETEVKETTEEHPIPEWEITSEAQQKPKENFPIVGIGTSAGGLSAFESFFSGIPTDISPGASFVIIQHLDPKHKSILNTLIGRYTNMPVYEIEDGMDIQLNSVYVIPPNSDLVYREEKLHLVEPVAQHGHRTPIDFFFRSLAEGKTEMAVVQHDFIMTALGIT